MVIQWMSGFCASVLEQVGRSPSSGGQCLPRPRFPARPGYRAWLAVCLCPGAGRNMSTSTPMGIIVDGAEDLVVGARQARTRRYGTSRTGQSRGRRAILSSHRELPNLSAHCGVELPAEGDLFADHRQEAERGIAAGRRRCPPSPIGSSKTLVGNSRWNHVQKVSSPSPLTTSAFR